MSNNFELRARFIGGFILLLLGGWVLHSFLTQLVWAIVLAITTWPFYRHLLTSRYLHKNNTWVALVITLLIAAIFLTPLSYGLSRIINETQSLGQILVDAQNVGIPPPAWLENLPVIGHWAKESWMQELGNSQAAKQSLHWLGTADVINHTRDFAGQILHHFFNFFITLIVLFFVYLHGDKLGRHVLASKQKLFGNTGVRYAIHAVTAVRATVNGLVLVGLGVGICLGLGYAAAGFSHFTMLGAITGVFGIVPIAAKLIFFSCVLVLFAQGKTVIGIGLLIYGFVIILLADNYVRPKLIGDAVKLPFIWTLLGILGGLENFGLLGLFLGPTLMAVLMSIWRDWVDDMNEVQFASNY